MDFIMNYLFLVLVAISIIVASIAIISGIVFISKCVIYLFEDFLDEMREYNNREEDY